MCVLKVVEESNHQRRFVGGKGAGEIRAVNWYNTSSYSRGPVLTGLQPSTEGTKMGCDPEIEKLMR